MRKHFSRKFLCPSVENEIELTEEIKTHIMSNRIFRIPKQTEQHVINQTINYNNNVLNYLNNIDPIKKLCSFTNHMNVNIIPFERSVEATFEKERQKLERGQGNLYITHDDRFDMVDNMTKVKSDTFDDFNIIYDASIDKILVYENGEWTEMRAPAGLKTIITTLQDYLFHPYECYLIIKIKNTTNLFERQQIKEHIKDHYTFLACLDIEPYVQGRSNNEILFTADDDEHWKRPSVNDIEAFSLSEEYMKIYRNVEVTQRQKANLMSNFLKLIKKNSMRNKVELNKAVMSLMTVDADFKKTVLCLS
jgi:hypothetical protein